MRGKQVKRLRMAAARLHLRLLADGKMEKPDGVKEANRQLRWLQRRLKTNFKRSSKAQKKRLQI